MVTAKKRQEFRIKLQKRARKLADKRIEAIEEEKQYKEVSSIKLNLKYVVRILSRNFTSLKVSACLCVHTERNSSTTRTVRNERCSRGRDTSLQTTKEKYVTAS